MAFTLDRTRQHTSPSKTLRPGEHCTPRLNQTQTRYMQSLNSCAFSSFLKSYLIKITVSGKATYQ